MVKGHKIEKRIEVKIFLETIKNYSKDQIATTQHTFFRLGEEERKIFKESVLIDYLTAKIPVLVGVQYNRSYAVFYDYSKNEAIRIILDMQPNKIEIVTFYIVDKSEIPRL